MCDKKECCSISIITLNEEEEKVIIHYDIKGDCIFVQHKSSKENVFREFELKNNLLIIYNE